MCIAVLYIHSYSSTFTGIENTFGKVVVGITYFMSRIICDCGVPVFIFISAILFYSKKSPSWNENVKKNIKTLLIPYLIFNTLWILIMLVRQHLRAVDLLNSDYINYGVWKLLDAYLGIKSDFKPALTVLWYIKDLFILKIRKPIYNNQLKNSFG